MSGYGSLSWFAGVWWLGVGWVLHAGAWLAMRAGKRTYPLAWVLIRGTVACSRLALKCAQEAGMKEEES